MGIYLRDYRMDLDLLLTMQNKGFRKAFGYT